MSMRAGFIAFVIALLATTAPSFAQDVQSRPDDTTPSRPGDATPCAGNACAPDVQEPRAPHGDSHARMLAAEVVRIDEKAGHVLLSTPLGMVAVPASPAVIAQLSVGDLVVLRVVPDSDDDSPSASPPDEDAPNIAPNRTPGAARGTRL